MSDTPRVTKNFAGVGTRDIEQYDKAGKNKGNPSYVGDDVRAKAIQAINDDYQNSFGNPFSSDTRLVKRDGLIQTNSVKESVERYIDWVINSSDERAVWIRDVLKSGKLKGKPIIYYKELGEPSHANALDYLINQYDWGRQSKVTDNQEIASAKVNDEVTHQVPTSFVDNVVRPTLNELKQVTSNTLTKDQRKELSDILDYVYSINPYITFGFVKDNPDIAITKLDNESKQKFINQTSGNTAWNSVSINLNTPTKDLDLFETVVHEYVHTATNKVKLLGYDDKGTIIDYWRLKAVQDTVRAYAEQNNISNRRLDYFLGVNARKGKEVNEVLTIGLTNPAVSSIVKNIKLDDGRSVHQFLQDTLKNIVEHTQKLDNFPQEYSNDHVLEVRESDRRRRENTLGNSERRARDTANENQSRTTGEVFQRQRDRQQATQNQERITYSLSDLEDILSNLNSKTHKGLTGFVMGAVKEHNPNITIVMSDEALKVDDKPVPVSYDTQTF